jgi:hypothetical protein
VKKGVDDIMRGPVIETEARRILNEGIALGEARGITLGETRGETKAKMNFVRTMLYKNFSDDVIIECSGISGEELKRIKSELLKS